MTKTDQQQCPLCLGANSCGNTGDSMTQCWCAQEVISRELLEQIPKTEKGCRCICRQCINNYSDANKLTR